MTDPVTWPSTLAPLSILANVVPFSRSGGRTLGGIERSTRTDRGYWSIAYKGVALGSTARRRAWAATRVAAGGTAGLLVVPVWSSDVNGAASGIDVEMAVAAAIGDTEVTLRLNSGIDDLAGVRFSFENALYETATASLVSGDEWTVPVFPAIRAAIPANAALELDLPTCLVRLATDREMDVTFTRGGHDRRDVSFVEAVDYWNDQA